MVTFKNRRETTGEEMDGSEFELGESRRLGPCLSKAGARNPGITGTFTAITLYFTNNKLK